ncbi:MAG: AAA family ATPase [Chloroflexia bacterium]
MPHKISLAGSYLDPAAESVLAASCGRVHALILGAPGWGKSVLARSFAGTYLSPSLALSCDPSTPPSRAPGRPHVGALLEGRERTFTEGSLSDRALRGAVLDEIFRASDPLWDALLPVLERPLPVVLATANWVAKGDRVEALKDRVALWVWLSVSASPQDLGAVADAALQRLALQVADEGDAAALGAVFRHPAWPDNPEAIREVWQMAPTPRAVQAVREVVESLAREALQAGFAPNPRRADQWARLIFGRTCLERASPDWAAPAEAALRALAYAWPASSEEEAATWRQVALRVVDRTGALVEALLGEIKSQLQTLASLPPERRAQMAMEVSRFLAEKEEALRAIPDERATRARKALDRWYRLAIMGRDPWAAPPEPEEENGSS